MLQSSVRLAVAAILLLLLITDKTEGATTGTHAQRRSISEGEQCCASMTCSDTLYPYCRVFSYIETPDVTSCSCASFCCLFRGCGIYPCHEDAQYHCHCIEPPGPNSIHTEHR